MSICEMFYEYTDQAHICARCGLYTDICDAGPSYVTYTNITLFSYKGY
jgi:hypothetical protein